MELVATPPYLTNYEVGSKVGGSELLKTLKMVAECYPPQ